MKKDDLTIVNHIGPARMKLLYESGITTIKKLYETPLGRLAQVKNIGKHYAQRIKDAVIEVYLPPADDVPKKPEGSPKKEAVQPKQKIQKKINDLNKDLKRANEKLKTLESKKQKVWCADVKKRSKKLKQYVKKLNNLEKNLPKKGVKKLGKKSDDLRAMLKKMGKKPKKKTLQALSRELQSFNKLLHKSIAK